MTVLEEKVAEKRLECRNRKVEECAANFTVLDSQERAVDPRLVGVILAFYNEVDADDKDGNDAAIKERESVSVE